MKTLYIIKSFTICILLIFFSFCVTGQTITKETTSVVTGTVCPSIGTSYKVSIPSNFGSCKIKWTVTNGVINGLDNQPTVSVTWSDTPGATSAITVKFSGCESGNSNEGGGDTKSELILSVRNQDWGTYGPLINVDYCTKGEFYLTVPRMFVLGTGGLGQPAQTEVAYAWTLPDGWQEVGTKKTGFFGTTTNYITIEPTGCSKPGSVTVYGTLAGYGPFCNSSDKSATATIALHGANPVVTVGPQVGYQGASYCNTDPVTFYATLNYALGCIQEYEWHHPASWSPVSQTANSITLRPSGSPDDANDIYAKVKFTCGTSIQSGNYKPAFNKPSINGSGPVCYQGTTFNVNYAPPGSTVTWTASPSNLFSPASGSFTSTAGINSFVIKTATSYFNGSATISINVVNTSCNLNFPSAPTSVWAGPPTQPGPISGEINPSTGGIYQYVSAYSSTGATYYDWITPYCTTGCTTPWSWFGGTISGPVNTLTPNFKVGSSSGNLQVAGYNGCGGSSFSKLRVFPVSGGGGGIQLISIYPNPGNHEVKVKWKEKDKLKPYDVFLYDKDSNKVYEASQQVDDEITIPVRQLPNGSYYLILTQGDLRGAQVLLVDHN